MLDGWRCLPISKVRSGHQKVVKKTIQGRWNREALEAHSPKIYFRAVGRSENPGLGNYLDRKTCFSEFNPYKRNYLTIYIYN